jgi:hypothetical protein
VVVNRHDPAVVIFGQITEVQSPRSPKDPAKVFDQHEVDLTRFDELFGLLGFFAVESFTASGSGDDRHFDWLIDVLQQPAPEQGLLVAERSNVLFSLTRGTDAANE